MWLVLLTLAPRVLRQVPREIRRSRLLGFLYLVIMALRVLPIGTYAALAQCGTTSLRVWLPMAKPFLNCRGLGLGVQG